MPKYVKITDYTIRDRLKGKTLIFHDWGNIPVMGKDAWFPVQKATVQDPTDGQVYQLDPSSLRFLGPHESKEFEENVLGKDENGGITRIIPTY